ncbi:MAG TPA: hypothetical protein DDZ80_25090 [Cyanobacteria bacterium UBA8803]|nr:hypothetical protein [Cyanobacteria bacterium UBA9273]HBL61574.1 hypothetical protein [Cyanobacteria bacterium UBA8803]
MNVLVDHNLRGHSVVLAGSLAASGWLELVYIRFVLFEEIGLEVNSSDRVVWQCAHYGFAPYLLVDQPQV